LAISLNHQTEAEFAARFWAKVREVRQQFEAAAPGSREKRLYGEKFGYLIWWLHGKVTSGDITSNAARLSFNAAYGRSLTAGQWNTFVTDTLMPIRDRYQAMLDQGDI